MREVAKTVRDAGVEPLMSAATVERQEWAARTRAKLGNEARAADEIGDLLDAIRTALAPEGLPTPALETLARSTALQIDACASLDSDDGHTSSKARRDKLVTKPALPNVNDVRAVRVAAPNDNAVQPET